MNAVEAKETLSRLLTDKFFVVRQHKEACEQFPNKPVVWGPFGSHEDAHNFMDTRLRAVLVQADKESYTYESDDTDPSNFLFDSDEDTFSWSVVQITNEKQ
jgi:hypothetical protein